MVSKVTLPSSRAVDEPYMRGLVETTVENSRKLRICIVAVMGYIV